MRYIVDNDLHIHSNLSLCCKEPEQTTTRILKYAEKNHLKNICLTDHFWDEKVPGVSGNKFYEPQDYAHISRAKPLPQADGINFLFGCETDMDRFFTVGVSKERYDCFDFIIIPTNHMHMIGFTLSEEDAASMERRMQLWIDRFDKVLDMDLPFHKVGLAHLTCRFTGNPSFKNFEEIIDRIPVSEMERLFTKAARLGAGIELNACDMINARKAPDILFRPYRIAKKCGCKFYLGSDAHCERELNECIQAFEEGIDALELEESDKFHIR